MKIVIIGQGYVGSALSIAAAKAGHEVIGFDTNAKVIDDLKEAERNLKNYSPTAYEAEPIQGRVVMEVGFDTDKWRSLCSLDPLRFRAARLLSPLHHYFQ